MLFIIFLLDDLKVECVVHYGLLGISRWGTASGMTLLFCYFYYSGVHLFVTIVGDNLCFVYEDMIFLQYTEEDVAEFIFVVFIQTSGSGPLGLDFL